MMKRRFILLILLIIGILCSMSFVSLLLYFDPYIHRGFGILLLIVCFLAGISSISSLIVYFIKKIYYRGEVGMYHILTSLRQSFLFSLFLLGIVIIVSLGIPLLLPLGLLFSSIVFTELFIQSL